MPVRLDSIEEPVRLDQIPEGPMRLSEIEEEPKEPLLLRGAKAVKEHAEGSMEVWKSLLSGVAAAPVAGIAGVGALAIPGVEAGNVVNKVQSALTYEPKSETGKKYTEAVMVPFELLQKGIHKVGEAGFEATGSPAVGAGIETAINAGLMFLPFSLKGKPGVKPKAEPKPLVEVQLDAGTADKARVFLGKDFSDTAVPDKAVNVNLRNLETVDDVKQAIWTVGELYKPTIDDARRGTITHQQTAALARDLGLTREELLKRRRGQAFNAEEAYAARSMLVQSGEELVNLAGKARAGADADVFAFAEQLQKHAAIQAQVSGLTAEAGRALNQFKIKAASDAAREAAIKDALKVTGRENIEAMADALGRLDSPEALNKFVRDIQRPKPAEMLLEVWINSLLSGPQTHVVNSLSNTLTSLMQIPERGVAGVIGKFHGGEKVLLREPLYQAAGWIQGVKEGLRSFGQVVLKGEPLDELSKLELSRRKSITGEAFGLTGMPSKAVDLLGEGIRIPGRLLMAEDELFKAIAQRSELNTLAIRKAVQEGAPNTAARAAELIANPTPKMMDAAHATARYVTFTKPLGEAGSAVQKIANTHPAFRVVMPFIRTPTNIVKFAGERTPFALLSKTVRDTIAKGGPEADIQLARLAVGTSVGAYVTYLAAEGKITGGGPSDPDLKRALRDTGWQPYSVKIGDTYYAYNRLEPLGMIVGTSADMAEIHDYIKSDEEKKNLASMITASVANNLTSKTFLRGITDLLNTLSDPDRYGEYWIQSLAGTAVPTAVAQYTRTQDPVIRETATVLDRIKSRIPGYSEDLPPRRNAFGDPVILEGGVGPDLLSPIYASKEKKDPVYNEIARLKLDIAMPEKKLFDSELAPKEYDQYVVTQGRLAKTQLDALIGARGYQTLPDWAKKDAIKSIVEKSRQVARIKMITTMGKERVLESKTKKFKE